MHVFTFFSKLLFRNLYIFVLILFTVGFKKKIQLKGIYIHDITLDKNSC